MWCMPQAAEPLWSRSSIAFTRPNLQRAMVLTLGAILDMRQRTVSNMVRAVVGLVPAHWSDFHHVLCLRVWSNWPLGRVLANLILSGSRYGDPVNGGSRGTRKLCGDKARPRPGAMISHTKPGRPEVEPEASVSSVTQRARLPRFLPQCWEPLSKVVGRVKKAA